MKLRPDNVPNNCLWWLIHGIYFDYLFFESPETEQQRALAIDFEDIYDHLQNHSAAFYDHTDMSSSVAVIYARSLKRSGGDPKIG